jgi:15-cis-phytoene synthase
VDEDLDSLVRRVDPDRWLASRFIGDEEARADVVALYAFDYELSRVHKVTSQPLLGEIRLTWWAEAVAEIFEGHPVRRHPVTLALASAVARHSLPRGLLDAIIDARLPELEGRPADAVAASTAIMTLAARILGAGQVDASAAAGAWATGSIGDLARANRELRDLPSTAFPAVAYASLVRAPSASAVGKRLRLAWAVLRGKL